MRCAWFHPFSGVAGDMALGSLIDAGADVDAVTEILDGLEVTGWRLSVADVLRGGIGGTKVHVATTPSTVVRTAASIDALLAGSSLPTRVIERARLVFAALARAEGHLHRSDVAHVHFHEVGALDAIIDIVGTCAALEVLDIDVVTSAAVTTGTGLVRAAHGIIPNPAPAVVELLAHAPTMGVNESVELTTPTGAALLAALVDRWGPLPSMRISSQGFGAGTNELQSRPNLTQVVIGELDDTALGAGQPVVLLETNLDDVTGEVLAHTVTALLDAGAHDAWLTPVLMKKGRPGHIVHVLADVGVAEAVRAVLVAETGSLGVRGQRLERWVEPRRIEPVTSTLGPGHVKVSDARVKAEFDDAVSLAASNRRPLREVQAELEAAWRNGGGAVPAHAHGHSHDHGDGHDHGHDHDHDHDHDDPHPTDGPGVRWSQEGPADPVA